MSFSDTTAPIYVLIAEQEPYSSYAEVAAVLFPDGKRRDIDWNTTLRVMRTSDVYSARLCRLLRQLPDDALLQLVRDIHDKALPEQRATMDQASSEGYPSVWSARGNPVAGPAAFAFFAFKKLPPGEKFSPQWAEFVEAQYKELEALVACHQLVQSRSNNSEL